MLSKSCSSFPLDTFGCRTYPHEVNYVKSIFPQSHLIRSLLFEKHWVFYFPVCLGYIHVCWIIFVHLFLYRALWTVLSLPADIVDGNLKSVMRIILALAAHFKPSANHRAASGNPRSLTRGTSSHNPLSPIALAQGAAAALASARHDVSQPAHAACLPRYARLPTQKDDARVVSAVLWWTNSENLIKDLWQLYLSLNLSSLGSWGLDVEKSVCVRALVQQYEKRSPDEQVHVHSSR